MSSFDVIAPFLKPVMPFLEDEEVSEVMINAAGNIFVERSGLLEAVPGVCLSEGHRRTAVKNIARELGNDISEEQPTLDARLPDGSRIAAVFAPTSVGGTIMSIRKFRKGLTVEELVRREMMTSRQCQVLKNTVQDEDSQNILVSGGVGSGKTTLLNALSSFIPPEERIITIEDTAELSLSAPNLVRLESRREQSGVPAVTIRDLVKQSLRLRPDRLIVGEVRGQEAFELLQALNSGQAGGSMCTIHANSATMSLARLRTCASMANSGLPDSVIARNIAETINVLVHLRREKNTGKRYVWEMLEVHEYDPSSDYYSFEEIT
jgi:pilus assembly protein CpaF